MELLIRFPWIALVAAILFFVLWRIHPKRSSLIAAVAWLIYGIYEFTVFFQLTCDSTCIRVDLLVLYPLLLIISLWAFVAALWHRKN